MRKVPVYILLVFAFTLSACNILVAQNVTAEQCRQIIRKAYKKMDLSEKTSNRNTIFMHYTTKISMWDKEEVPDTKTEVKLISANDQIHFLTKEASFYSDQKDVFLLIPRSGDLIHSKGMLTNGKDNFFVQQTSLIKDSLLITSKLSGIREITANDGSILLAVDLIPSLKAKAFYKIEKIVFLIDRKNERIKQLQINYSKQSTVRQIENNYLTIDTNYKTKLDTPVYYLFFDKRNKLLPKYKDFNYINNTL